MGKILLLIIILLSSSINILADDKQSQCLVQSEAAFQNCYEGMGLPFDACINYAASVYQDCMNQQAMQVIVSTDVQNVIAKINESKSKSKFILKPYAGLTASGTINLGITNPAYGGITGLEARFNNLGMLVETEIGTSKKLFASSTGWRFSLKGTGRFFLKPNLYTEVGVIWSKQFFNDPSTNEGRSYYKVFPIVGVGGSSKEKSIEGSIQFGFPVSNGFTNNQWFVKPRSIIKIPNTSLKLLGEGTIHNFEYESARFTGLEAKVGLLVSFGDINNRK